MPKAETKWTAFDTARLHELHEAGMTCNAIAREMGRASSTIARRARSEGLSFMPDKRTIGAITVNRVNGLDKRTQLANRLWAKAHQLMDQLEQPHKTFKIGGKDNTYTEHELDRPDVDAVLTIMRSISIAVDKASTIEELNSQIKEMSDLDLFLQNLTKEGAEDEARRAAAGDPSGPAESVQREADSARN